MNLMRMCIGDIVKVLDVDLASRRFKIGILVSLPRRMYMAGRMAEVMVDGKIKRVREQQIETIGKGEQVDES